MEKSLFEQNGGTYRQVGDYFLPNIPFPKKKPSLSEYGDSDTYAT